MADAEQPELGEYGHAGDDHVVPFQVENLDTRGRVVQMGRELDAILSRHAYPEPVSRLLAEVVVLVALLGTSLKFNGKFIVQTKTDGPVDMLVADLTVPGSLRAYARFDETRLQLAVAAGETKPEQLLGDGVLALTIDQGPQTQRYQGIVALDGASLEDVARTYFRQSEQIPTDVRLAAGQQVLPGGDEIWRAGGIVAQFLPDAPERMRMGDLPGGDGDDADTDTDADSLIDDAWQEARLLVGTVEDLELLDPTVGSERLLNRLFHEHGVRVYEGVELKDDCSCSRQKIEAVLTNLSEEERAESVEDGAIKVRCEFCSTEYAFDPGEFAENS
ncbi:Hsp33 family molecular chaperone [Notoacmeibacter sp. MSK16QG-6]|uniref:Hsp33 family molecular chaperone n=1 Tax=Notoacmeibacter sp. MSK16QG-6 TaxID=2957982 RepID=UPI0020A170E0|nr:Hsp33 family molecular chaperone [Notoacmeibacter sp. MSK16QG-6]MCP1198611.1 Hsp33 family molecular chaperone [Notoacmeibacter sp. MSK16QG-6]